MDENKKYELEEFISELEKYRGRHTELVSVYVPAGYSLINIAKHLEQEKSTATNIKSKTTRKNVLDALERLTRHLKLIRKNPENGIALFAGNISENEGQTNIEVFSIEPPMPIKTRLYRCDQTFVLDILKEMLEVGEVYGLLVVDRREATIGILEGKQIRVLHHMESFVPGKTEKGGQCLSPDTLIMKDDGEIMEIKDSHNPLFVISENFNRERTEKTPLLAKWENKKQLFKVITKYPRLEIKASQDHVFFVRTEKGIEERHLLEIKEGDFLIMPGKVDVRGELQKIDFIPPIIKGARKIKVPGILDKTLALIFGYYLGDGSYEPHRINFFEQREEVAQYYAGLLEGFFGIPCKLKFREDKNYYGLRVHSHVLTHFFKNYFLTDNKTLKDRIPSIILKSPNEILASFIKGFFDAEGYVSPSRIGLGINNEKIIRQLQLCLLRFGIISSFVKYDNNRNPYSDNPRYTLEISCLESMKKFYSLIGFTSLEKKKKLMEVINKRGNQNNINQIVVNGKDIAQIIRNSGEGLVKFNSPSFFNNKRQMSKEVFKRRILDKIDNRDLRKRLEFIYNSNLVLVKINRIEPLYVEKTIDIETKNHNFVANGLIVHNSAARYARIREGMAKEFFRKVAEAVKKNFFDMKKLKGIIVGGPGPTKEDFLKEGQLVTALKDKVIGVKDIGYADQHGLDLLVECSQDLLAEQEITREKKILEDFFTKLGKEREKVAYGKADVEKALERGAVGLLIVSKKLGKKEILELSMKAKNTSSEVELVSEETEEGQQFGHLGGIGAVLRFAV